jgi:hypothetical protein
VIEPIQIFISRVFDAAQQLGQLLKSEEAEAFECGLDLPGRKNLRNVSYSTIHSHSVKQQQGGKSTVSFARGIAALLKCRAVPDERGFNGGHD